MSPEELMKNYMIKPIEHRLIRDGGGYEVIHRSPGLELGIYVLKAPHPDEQQPHDDDEVYVVLGGRGKIDVAGERINLSEGATVFVPAGVPHRFVEFGTLSTLVIFTRPADEATPLQRATYE